MLFDHLPFIIAGAVSIVGMTILVLRKVGVLIFRKEKEEGLCKHCEVFQNDNGNEVKVVKCDTHDLLASSVKDIEDRQSLMLQRQEDHQQALRNGKKEFKDIQRRLSNLRVGVAVLIERSGGAAKEFDDTK